LKVRASDSPFVKAISHWTIGDEGNILACPDGLWDLSFGFKTANGSFLILRLSHCDSLLNNGYRKGVSMSYLITGATGNIGAEIVRKLVQTGEKVKAMSRNPGAKPQPEGVESIVGDITAAEFEPRIFEGVSGVFLFPVDGKVDAFLKAARASGVERVVALSSLAAAEEFPRDRNSTSNRHHAAIEKSVLASGLDFTILRPVTFANNLRQWAYSIKTQGMVFGPYPESAQALIHEGDVADVAVAALTDSRHSGAIYTLTGPEALTQADQLRIIGEAIGKPLRYQKIGPEEFRKSMAQFVSENIIKMLLDYWSDTVSAPDVVRKTVEEVTCEPARKFSRWAADHAREFA